MMNLRNSIYYLLFFILFLLTCKQSKKESIYDISKSALSTKGMVVTAHPLATDVGVEILKKGGNAADAAIAVQFALSVVYPRAGNIGGGGFLVYRHQDGKISSLDFRERAPLASHRDMYLDSNSQVIEALSKDGMLAVAIPGTVAGLVEIHQKLGSLQPWSSLIEPAINLAKKGFRITKLEADRLNLNRELFARYNPPDMPFLSAEPWKEGDWLVQKKLAATLRIIADQGREGFYAGTNAQALLALSIAKNGIISKEDLDNYKVIWREPFTINWRDFNIHTMGLPSSGGIVLGQILSMIEDRLIDSLGYQHPYNVHLIVEAEKRAFADRARYLGDADYYSIPMDSILDSTYLTLRIRDFDPSKASSIIHPDSTLSNPVKESFETTHLSIVDSEGNAASMTVTLNGNFGCKVWVPEGGYFLNNVMDDFSVKPGVPNLFGLIGAEANAIQPGKRMLSSMSPTIVQKGGKLWLVLGSPGGPAIITSILQVFLNSAAFGMNIDEAVQASRYHHQWIPDEITYEEKDFPPSLIEDLTAKGHSLRALSYMGMIEAIMVESDSLLHGAADRRGDDDAKGL